MKNKKVTSAADISPAIIGTYEGKCGDGTVTNENGLDISTEVWETVFNSEEFKEYIKLGHYIGFLGHPEDPGCQEFEKACIVMTEGHVDPDGQVYGKFNLIDTPVGRVVKTLQDAGVTFGISVRGAGDIIDNSVEADTFVFRGFDLVAFPAYKDAIPTFTEIAASSDVNKVKKYKTICASVEKNLQDITSVESLEIIQSQFAKSSDTYANIQKRIDDIKASDSTTDISEDKVAGVMSLYLAQVEANKKLSEDLKTARRELDESKRRLVATKGILSSQVESLKDVNASIEGKYKTSIAASQQLKKENERLQNDNLIYHQKVQKRDKTIQSKDSIIALMKAEKSKTVRSSTRLDSEISNRDKKIRELEGDIEELTSIVASYQDAYASMYARAIGVGTEGITVNTTTSVDELKQMISSSTQLSKNRHQTQTDISSVADYSESDNDIVTV